MIINTESPDQPEVRDMLARLDACCASVYPSGSKHLMDLAFGDYRPDPLSVFMEQHL